MLQRSVLLAVESLRRRPSLEADQVLRRALPLLARPISQALQPQSAAVVIFSLDGRHFASAGGRYARVWDTFSGRLVTEMAHDAPVSTVAFDITRRRTVVMLSSEWKKSH
jgi:hypothetical protein